MYYYFTKVLQLSWRYFTKVLQLSWKIPLQDSRSFGRDPRLHGLTSVMSCWRFQARVKREDFDAWGSWSSTVRYGWFLEQTLSAPQWWEHCRRLFTQMTVVSPPPASWARLVSLFSAWSLSEAFPCPKKGTLRRHSQPLRDSERHSQPLRDSEGLSQPAKGQLQGNSLPLRDCVICMIILRVRRKLRPNSQSTPKPPG